MKSHFPKDGIHLLRDQNIASLDTYLEVKG